MTPPPNSFSPGVQRPESCAVATSEPGAVLLPGQDRHAEDRHVELLHVPVAGRECKLAQSADEGARPSLVSGMPGLDDDLLRWATAGELGGGLEHVCPGVRLHAANQADSAKHVKEAARTALAGLDLEAHGSISSVRAELELPKLRVTPGGREAKALFPALRAYLNRRSYVNCGELFGVGGEAAEGVVDGTLDWACE